MELHEALYNWLTIKKVAEARPDDHAAQDTYDFFKEILEEDHHVNKLNVEKDKQRYTVHYWVENQEQTQQYPAPMIDALLHSIEAEPRYNEQ